MSSARQLTVVLAVISAFEAGWILSGFFGGPVAQAAPGSESTLPATTAPEPVGATGLLCRRFSADLEKNPQTDTADRTTEIGEWVAGQDGYSVDSVDFEVGQKPTGYPQGWVQVCLKKAP